MPVNANAQQYAPADLVLTNGDIYTVDSARPRAQAMAIRGEKFVAVGSRRGARAVEGGPAGGWEPQGKLPLDVCIYDYTAASAYAEFEEAHKSQIKTGMFADIVVYPTDIARMPLAELLHTFVEMTISGGRIVYQRH